MAQYTLRLSLVKVLLGALLLGILHADPVHLRSAGEGERLLLAAPRDVYAVEITNNLTVRAVVSVVFVKANNDTTALNHTLETGGVWKAGPMDYTEQAATYRYIVQSVTLQEPQLTLLSSPFEGVRGVTPLLRIDITGSKADAGLKARPTFP